MKTIFDKENRILLINRIEQINEGKKAEWISLINEYENYSNPKFIHDFFGKITKEQIGILVYKHTDHHLRQFGV